MFFLTDGFCVFCDLICVCIDFFVVVMYNKQLFLDKLGLLIQSENCYGYFVHSIITLSETGI